MRVFDRQKDMINRGGLKIYSAEVEFGARGPSRRRRERHHRKAVPGAGRARACRDRDPDRDVSGEALRAWCAERLSDYKVPETMALTVEPLPRNANGKVMKRQLREAWERT